MHAQQQQQQCKLPHATAQPLLLDCGVWVHALPQHNRQQRKPEEDKNTTRGMGGGQGGMYGLLLTRHGKAADQGCPGWPHARSCLRQPTHPPGRCCAHPQSRHTPSLNQKPHAPQFRPPQTEHASVVDIGRETRASKKNSGCELAIFSAHTASTHV